jgi:hypothetical protein
LELFLSGSDSNPIYGVAGIDSTPLSVVLENGEPISATYRFTSKGPWGGLANAVTKGDDDPWGGFEGSDFDLDYQN